MANFTGLAAARHARARATRAGTSRRDGLHGAPRVRVVVGEERARDDRRRAAATSASARATAERVAADDQGRMRADALARRWPRRIDGPTIVCAQAGNVNTGAFDPLDEICDAAHEHGAWVHVDGAFGLWAAVDPRPSRSSSPASSAPTRGPPTRTSGSTSRTTAASRSCRDADAHRGAR